MTARRPQDGPARENGDQGRPPSHRAAEQGRGVETGRLTALQSVAGNAAVVQMLHRAGHGWVHEQHQHGAGCGHQQAVQRSAVHEVLRAPGRPLDEATRTDMESRLGADFSDVRIHDDAAARASAGEVGAHAYTSGSHVVIGDGGADKHTLAHELTHVIQRRQGPVAGTDNGGGLKVSDPGDRFERDAEANARRAMASSPVQRDAVEGAEAVESAEAVGTSATVGTSGTLGTSEVAQERTPALGPAVVQRYHEGSLVGPGNKLVHLKVSQTGQYFMIVDRYDTTTIWGSVNAAVPRYCRPTEQQNVTLTIHVGNQPLTGAYTEYEPESAFLADCSHTAEEIMHRRRLQMGQDASRIRGGAVFGGEGHNGNVQEALAYAWRRGAGNGEERPNPGEAFSIIETMWDMDDADHEHASPSNESGWPYHVAAVVAVDGDDRITIEQTAGSSDAVQNQGYEGIIDIYTSGSLAGGAALPASFHGRHGGAFSQGAVTVTLAPINEGRLRQERGARRYTAG
ncbi:hypothetical protein AMK27_11095 [Streptomyces sp. CB02009]|uniref:eCIS core domain-containing protein n=1 Tax=Streptomyces sp. CB02009 TaxID=1703938 RepID=UPI00093B8E49|nr:hypothetical protein AMK27_11095 [Streptomyces sp. CB02009]